MRLSLLSIMLDEGRVAAKWAAGWRRVPDIFDEVVVIDGGSADDTVQQLLGAGLCAIHRPFPADFSDQRNFGIAQTHGEWIFELDADEVPSAPLLLGLRQIIADADRDGVDCIGIPRLNFHDDVLQASPGYRGLDFQYRLHRRDVLWHKPVHEEPMGYKKRLELDVATGTFLQHIKNTTRHMQRNEMYRRMGG